ncbi:MAG: cation:proton antiporter [Thermoprotei archaeon]|nr:MAG: cation:proton antiporter [Thermoprotei archaeon]
MGTEEALATLLQCFALALIFGKLLEELVLRLKAPPVLGDLIAGLILGPTLLGVYRVSEVVDVVAWFGICMLLFYAGLETRYRDFMKNIPRAGLITVGEAIAAFAMGVLVGLVFGYPLTSSLFIGAVLEATSVSVTARTLVEIDKLRTIEGCTILGVAVLDDVTSLVTIVACASLVRAHALAVTKVAEIMVLAFTYWLLVVIVFHKLSNYIPRIAYKMHTAESLLSILIGLFCLVAGLSRYLHLSPLIGAYAIGLALSEISGLAGTAEKVRSIAFIFSTLFFVTTAAKLDVKTALRPELVPFYVAMVLAAFAGKLLGAGLTSLIIGYPPHAALRIATGLFPRCEFCIVAAYIGLTYGVLGTEVYFAALMIVLVTNFATPPLLKLVFTRGPETREVKSRLGAVKELLIRRLRKR